MTNSRKRRQQVHRQRVIIVVFFILIVCLIAGYNIKRSVEKKETAAAAKIEQQTKEEEKTVKEEIKTETTQERAKRVKAEAQKKGTPKKVIQLIDKNKETIDFVEDYALKKDAPFAETIGEDLVQGQIPSLLQWDERWGYAPYGTSNVAVSGCGPVCMSMVVSGLTNDPAVTPDKVAAYGMEQGFVDEDNNTLWAFMEQASAHWNVKASGLSTDESEVKNALEAGHPIICSVGPGDFTKSGHFIVLTGYKDGQVTVNDPFNKKHSEKTWVYSEIQSQIVALWVYSV